MVHGDDFPGRDRPDKPQIIDIQEEPSNATKEWNIKATSRLETPLSAEEKAERQKVQGYSNSIGRGFNKLPTVQNVGDYYKQTRPGDKENLADSTATVFLDCYASHTGDDKYNKELARKSGEEAKQILRDVYGVKAKIIVTALGFDKDSPEGDNHRDRQVKVRITPGEKYSYGSDHTPDTTESKGRKNDHAGASGKIEWKMEGKAADKAGSHGKSIERSVLVEIGKLTKDLFRWPEDTKGVLVSTAELTAFESVIKKFGLHWDTPDNDHIRTGKPYTVGEYKSSLSLNDQRLIADDMEICSRGNGATGQDFERGLRNAVEVVNRVLRLGHTPEERHSALEQLYPVIYPIVYTRAQRLESIKGGLVNKN